jgi:hypothetical protein
MPLAMDWVKPAERIGDRQHAAGPFVSLSFSISIELCILTVLFQRLSGTFADNNAGCHRVAGCRVRHDGTVCRAKLIGRRS